MKPPRNSRSLVSILTDAEATLKDMFYEQPRAWMLQVRERMRDLPKTNFELGCKFAEMGKWHDAMFRFRVTLYLQPGYPQALYNLGCCYYHLGQRSRARQTLLQVLKEDPAHQDAIFMLSALDPQALHPSQRPQAMPRELVTKFFNSIAPDYNQAEAQNRYRGGVAVAEIVKPLLPASGLTVVDMGCGTGIASIPYRPQAQEIVGVELTPAMADKARSEAQGEKKLFDRVIEADIAVAGDSVPPGSADLVLLVNVVQFVGGLPVVLANAARALKPGGFLAITVEPYVGSDGYGLVMDSGRFGHSTAYVRQQAAPLALTVVKELKLPLYPDTNAELMILRKGNGS